MVTMDEIKKRLLGTYKVKGGRSSGSSGAVGVGIDWHDEEGVRDMAAALKRAMPARSREIDEAVRKVKRSKGEVAASDEAFDPLFKRLPPGWGVKYHDIGVTLYKRTRIRVPDRDRRDFPRGSSIFTDDDLD